MVARGARNRGARLASIFQSGRIIRASDGLRLAGTDPAARAVGWSRAARSCRYSARDAGVTARERKDRIMTIVYKENAPLRIEAAQDLYRRSTLGARRPVDQPDRFAGMLNNANLIITAWCGERCVGIARTLTDFTYVAYLADLAVDADYQRQGIGRQLIVETQQRLMPACMIVLLAAPQAHAYYARLGFAPHPRAWVLRGNCS